MYKILNIVIIFLLSFACHASENVFTGTWQLISGEYIDHNDKLIEYDTLNLHSIKVISETHFSFVKMSGDKFWSAGSGTYHYTKKEYTESPVYTSYNAPKGKKYIFKYTKQGDKWFSSRWENNKRVEYEIWQRISH